MVTNVNTVVTTTIEEDYHQSIQALATDFKNQLRIHLSNSNRRIGNEASVLRMGTALPVNEQCTFSCGLHSAQIPGET